MTELWQLEFLETGGYDCMTGAWRISTDSGRELFRVDQAQFGQDNCDYQFRANLAQEIATHIVELHNLYVSAHSGTGSSPTR